VKERVKDKQNANAGLNNSRIDEEKAVNKVKYKATNNKESCHYHKNTLLKSYIKNWILR